MTDLYRLFFPIVCSLLLTTTLFAQTVAIGSVDRYADCSGTFTDSGGPAGDHAISGEVSSITICPNPGATSSATRLDFTFLSVDGILTLFDGESTAADTLRQIGRVNNGQAISVTATTRNTSGCITVEFISAGQREGWEASISCVAPCQAIEAAISSTSPAVNSDGFIRSCPGELISLTGTGLYPDDGVNYDQSDEQSIFRWRFGDGTAVEGRELTEINYGYIEEGSYLATLEITDQRGCQSANRVSRRIGVLSGPELSIAPSAPPPICPDEEIQISTSASAPAEVTVTALPRSLRFGNAADSVRQIDIPASSDEVRSSVLRVDGFDRGLKITSVEDFESLCLGIEHSYIGDLSMWLECPEGARLDLLRYAPTDPNTADKQRFGYGDRDNTGPEEPETYCWTPGADRTVDEQAASMPPSPGTAPILPFDRPYLPLGNGFADLIGCSLNGSWTLYIRDLSPEDDGTIYSFDLTFSDELEAARQRVVILDSVSLIATPGLQSIDDRSATFSAPHPGYYHLPLRGAPDLSCATDSFVRIDVQSPVSAPCQACGPAVDTSVAISVCAGTPSRLPQLLRPAAADSLRYVARENATVPTTAIDSRLTVAEMQADRFSADVDELVAVCIDLRSPNDLSEIEVVLVAPGGQRIVVAERGDLSGNRLQNCFTVATLSQLVTLGGSPIAGEWQLLASSNDGATILLLEEWSIAFLPPAGVTYSWSGDTEILSCTDCPDPEVITSTNASVTLTARDAGGCVRTASYTLGVSPLPDDLSARITPACRGARNGRIEPSVDLQDFALLWSDSSREASLSGAPAGTYTLTVTNPSGCSRDFSFELTEAESPRLSVEVIDEQCAGDSNGRIVLTPLDPGAAADYRYIWPGGRGDSTSATLNDLPSGTYPISVAGPDGCRFDTVVILSGPAPLAVNASSTDPSCAGTADGRIQLEPVGGTAPYTFDWQDGEEQTVRENVPAGTYRVTVTDARSCTVDSVFALMEPPPLSLSLEAESPVCAGDATGEITIVAAGGVGAFNYRIDDQPVQSSAFLGGLAAGSYEISAVDANGCSLSDSVRIEEGTAITVDLGPDLDILFGDSTLLRGRISGGLPPVAYRWFSDVDPLLPCPDCETLPVTPLFSGLYRLTVTDAQGCSARDDLRLRVVRDRRFAVPSAFSPNGDGRNDRLLVFGGAGTQVLSYRVYNRWGGLIFRTGNFSAGDSLRGWDGTDDAGKVLPTGTYVYTIEVRFEDGFTERKSGTVHLIR
jgi:gliding motility-associated-like protein